MKITLNIKTDDFPYLAKLKDKELSETIMKVFRTGYNIHFPQINENQESSYDIIAKIDSLKANINNEELLGKISSLELSLNKLIGIGSNSIKKGSLAENVLEEIINKRYGDIIYEKTAHIAHSGDAWLVLPDGEKIILESKNYNSTINKDEVEKLRYDMIYNNIKWAIFVSFNSGIQGTKEMDIISFTHHNQTYYAIMISNLTENMAKLDLGIEIIRKLINNFSSNKNKFPWILNDINSSLENLEKIVQQNYLLRDSFYVIEREINHSLNNYHTKLRDYQWSLEKEIKKIIDKIRNTINDSSSNFMDLTNIIINDNKNKKVFPLIVRLIDLTIKKLCNIVINEPNHWSIYKDEEIVANVKIQLNKIIITIINNDINMILSLNNDSINKKNLELLESIL